MWGFRLRAILLPRPAAQTATSCVQSSLHTRAKDRPKPQHSTRVLFRNARGAKSSHCSWTSRSSLSRFSPTSSRTSFPSLSSEKWDYLYDSDEQVACNRRRFQTWNTNPTWSRPVCWTSDGDQYYASDQYYNLNDRIASERYWFKSSDARTH